MLFTRSDRRRVEEALRRRIARGEQVFVVCPLIDPSDALGVKAVTAEYDRLRQEVFHAERIGLLHGKLKTAEKIALNRPEVKRIFSSVGGKVIKDCMYIPL